MDIQIDRIDIIDITTDADQPHIDHVTVMYCDKRFREREWHFTLNMN